MYNFGVQNIVALSSEILGHILHTHLNDLILPFLKAQVRYWTSTQLLQYQGFLLSTSMLVKGLTIHELLVALKVFC